MAREVRSLLSVRNRGQVLLPAAVNDTSMTGYVWSFPLASASNSAGRGSDVYLPSVDRWRLRPRVACGPAVQPAIPSPVPGGGVRCRGARQAYGHRAARQQRGPRS